MWNKHLGVRVLKAESVVAPHLLEMAWQFAARSAPIETWLFLGFLKNPIFSIKLTNLTSS